MLSTYTNPRLDTILQSVSQLSKTEVDNLMLRLKKIQYQNHSTVLESNEAELLKKINSGVEEAQLKRYKKLRKKLHLNILTTTEHKEYLELINVIEQYTKQRLEYLIQLAKLRNTTLNILLKQLDIKPKVYVG